MSEIAPGVHVLSVLRPDGRPGNLNVCLLVEGETATMVDAGMGSIAGPLSDTLRSVGLTPSAVRRIIVTHRHRDHTGGLAEAKALTGAEIWAHAEDAEAIGETAGVDLALVGGEDLRVLGGCRILHTPGHTPGHLSLFLPRLSLLIAGDVLRYESGRVTDAPEQYSADPALSAVSARALVDLGFERLLPYHGDYLDGRAAERARRDLG